MEVKIFIAPPPKPCSPYGGRLEKGRARRGADPGKEGGDGRAEILAKKRRGMQALKIPVKPEYAYDDTTAMRLFRSMKSVRCVPADLKITRGLFTPSSIKKQ